MPFYSNEAVRYFKFEIFSQAPLVHAVFTRRGGVSSPPWDELNVGSTVGDSEENVRENLRRSFATLGRDTRSIYDSWLVHGTKVLIADHPDSSPRNESRKADIILTANPEVTLFMRYADCVPIFLYDPENKAIGLVHAGWRGTIEQAAEKAVAAMVSHFGSSPGEILAAIGPSICQDHYEVGIDVSAKVEKSFGSRSSDILSSRNGSIFLDLRSANRETLIQSGVNQVEAADICTACDLEDWFSHRGEGGHTGRFGAMIGLTVDD